MRFDAAREAGLDEHKVALVADAGIKHLAPQEVAALALTDALIGIPAPLEEDLTTQLKAHFSEAQLIEMSVAVSLFLGMSKVLITLGLEPEEMPVTVLPTPGS